jgi:hypothetical protein
MRYVAVSCALTQEGWSVDGLGKDYAPLRVLLED